MSRLVNAFLFCLIVFISCGTPGKPVLELSSYTFNYDTIFSERGYDGYVIIKNSGNAALVIKHLYPDCACTNASTTKSVIPPGDTSKLTFHLNTYNKYEGDNINTICIEANTDSMVHVLWINYFIKDH